MRIVSLIASATEIVCALGYESSLVGRSHECDFPPSVRSLPVLTQPRFDPVGTSREIDRRVKSLAVRSPARDALGVYEVFADKLRELHPTHIITQTQCDVCAVSLRDVEAAVREITDLDVRIVSLQPNSIENVWTDMLRTADALEDPAAGERLVESVRERIDAVASRSKSIGRRPRIAGIEWVDPLMAFGNWTPELIRLAGGECLFGIHGEHSPWMQFEQIVEADPDVIVIAPCGFDLARAREDVPLLAARPEWSRLRAARLGRVYVADGNQYFNRPGPRLVETVEILAEILHPEAFSFGHEGGGWERTGR